MSEYEIHERNVINRLGLVFEGAGMAPIAGRLLGRLLLCEPAEQSSTELADWLDASKGSISTQTQALVRAGLIRRSRRTGSRSIYYAIEPSVWSDALSLEVYRTEQLHALGMEATALKAEMGIRDDERLTAFMSFCTFFLERLPGLIEEWKAAQAGSSGPPYRFVRKES